jgi:hypothetical protein
MAAPLDLESLRSVFADRRTQSSVGKVLKLEVAADKSVLRAQCRILSQDRDVIAKVAWDASGPESGSFQFPQVGDLVLILFAEGDDNQAYLIKRLSTNIDKLPLQAVTNDLVHRALAGKNLQLLSDTKIFLGMGTAEPTEPLVLGLVLQTLLADLLTVLSTQATKIADLSEQINLLATDLAAHTHPYLNVLVPAFTSPPVTAAAYTGVAAAVTVLKTDFLTAQSDLDALKSEPVENGDILSDLAFTEKGGG